MAKGSNDQIICQNFDDFMQISYHCPNPNVIIMLHSINWHSKHQIIWTLKKKIDELDKVCVLCNISKKRKWPLTSFCLGRAVIMVMGFRHKPFQIWLRKPVLLRVFCFLCKTIITLALLFVFCVMNTRNLRWFKWKKRFIMSVFPQRCAGDLTWQ